MPSASRPARGPAISIVASANVVEAVTSPSAPRVNTFIGANSATNAKAKNIIASTE